MKVRGSSEGEGEGEGEGVIEGEGAPRCLYLADPPMLSFLPSTALAPGAVEGLEVEGLEASQRG